MIIRYFCPLFWAFYSLYLNPWLVFKLIKWENTPLKSKKEQSFLSKFNFTLIMNLVVVPWLSTYFFIFFEFALRIHAYQYLKDDGEEKEFDHLEAVLKSIQNIAGFYFRLFCQVMLLSLIYQLNLDFQVITACFEKVIKDNYKTSFDQWYYDLSFKNTVSVVVFAFGLFFSLSVPLITPLIIVLILLQFYIDKYNLLYIYPLEFESQTISRKSLIKNSFFAIILFQMGMVVLGFTRMDPVSNKISFYWIGFIVIQIVVIVITFEFMRKPWEGSEIELEKIL